MPYSIDAQTERLGEHVHAWRMVLGLTAEQVSARAGISLSTLRKLENGDPGVRLESFLQVVRAIGVLDDLVASVDPLETDLGRARAGLINRKRAR
jgi:transcriptional regulator with XRE-family HTH domain